MEIKYSLCLTFTDLEGKDLDPKAQHDASIEFSKEGYGIGVLDKGRFLYDGTGSPLVAPLHHDEPNEDEIDDANLVLDRWFPKVDRFMAPKHIALAPPDPGVLVIGPDGTARLCHRHSLVDRDGHIIEFNRNGEGEPDTSVLVRWCRELTQPVARQRALLRSWGWIPAS